MTIYRESFPHLANLRAFSFFYVLTHNCMHIKYFPCKHVIWFWSFRFVLLLPRQMLMNFACSDQFFWQSLSHPHARMADPASGSHLVIRKRESCDPQLFPHQRDPCINAPMALSQVHLFMVLFIEMMCASAELLCSAQPGFLSTSPALQVAHRTATCNSTDQCPVYNVRVSCAVSQGGQHKDQALLELNKQ